MKKNLYHLIYFCLMSLLFVACKSELNNEDFNLGKVSDPYFSLPSCIVEQGTKITINCETTDVTIYYTIDGSIPTELSLKYIDGIFISSDVTVKAIAMKTNMDNSNIVSMSYKIALNYAQALPGDYVLEDGCIIRSNSDLSNEQKSNVVAVIIKAKDENFPALGVGIKQGYNQVWCTNTADGHKEIISGLVGYETFGFTDGRNGLSILQKNCDDAKNLRINYPAWYYCQSYAFNNGLTGEMAKGWYLPTVRELTNIYINKDIINSSLLNLNVNQFGSGYYLSSNMDGNDYGCVLTVNLKTKEIKKMLTETSGLYVCCIRVFED